MTTSDPRKITLIRGPAAIRVAHMGLGFSAVWAATLIAGLAFALAGGEPASLLFGLVGLNLATLLVMLAGLPFLNTRTKRELTSGYTTLASGHPEVPRVHFPTGIVLREVSAPELTASERRAMIGRAKHRDDT